MNFGPLDKDWFEDKMAELDNLRYPERTPITRAEAEAKYGRIHTGFNVFWTAHFPDVYDGAEDAGRQYIGHGRTEAEAVAELLEQVDEDEE